MLARHHEFCSVSDARLTSGRAMREDLLHIFSQERTVAFKGEAYLVRDNGAVFRQSRRTGRRRQLDNRWTFGSVNRSAGYLVLSDHAVHQIVATAFHGPKPSSEHVVDHIDTNRFNNRPENLRWVTRLENILLNPITRRRIELAYGSLDAFFANPGTRSVPNLEWMQTVTKEQAQESLRRLREWAEKGEVPRGGTLGTWVFGEMGRAEEPKSLQEPIPPTDTQSLTAQAVQRSWRTPTAFPICPNTASLQGLETYYERLRFGVVFARNQYSESTVITAQLPEEGLMAVLSHTNNEIKEWAVAKVFVEQGLFCHESVGMYFTLQGALKAYCEIIGEPLDESIDDFA